MRIGSWIDDPCFYVSAIDPETKDKRYALLAGPFRSHEEALAMVDRAKREALDYGDYRAPFLAYGTCKAPNGYRSGVLNKKLGID